MKILFVSSSPLEYSASSNMRNLALLKGLIENGNVVSTLTPKAQVDSKFYDDSLCNLKFNKKYYIEMSEFRANLAVKKGKKSLIKSFLYKFLSKFKIYDFRSSLSKKSIIIDEKFDIIISSSDPKSSHLIAESLINNNPGITKKWIQYWGDPFAIDINKKTLLPRFVIENEEQRILSKCDKVVYVSPFTCEVQKNKYKSLADKMMFLPIPFQKEIFYDDTNNSNVTLGYYGDYNKNDRNILPLYNFVKNDNSVKLRICGNSDLALESTTNVLIESRQNIQKIRDYERETDILVCVCNRAGTQIPGKVYHYAATNKPILIILDGEYKDELKEYFNDFDRYILCYNDEKQIKEAVLKIISENKKYFPCDKLNSCNIAKKIVE